jgi:hypothetical protein
MGACHSVPAVSEPSPACVRSCTTLKPPPLLSVTYRPWRTWRPPPARPASLPHSSNRRRQGQQEPINQGVTAVPLPKPTQPTQLNAPQKRACKPAAASSPARPPLPMVPLSRQRRPLSHPQHGQSMRRPGGQLHARCSCWTARSSPNARPSCSWPGRCCKCPWRLWCPRRLTATARLAAHRPPPAASAKTCGDAASATGLLPPQTPPCWWWRTRCRTPGKLRTAAPRLRHPLPPVQLWWLRAAARG